MNTLLALGLTYQTQIYSTNLNQYSGLFAGGGSFNIPANLGLGMALHLTPDLLVATDYERIFYSGVAAVSNPGSNRSPIGSDNGPGFGWKSINVVKFGVAYKILPQFTVRAGYAYSDNPVTPENVTFNILAPGVTQHHISFGASYDVSPSSVLTIAYVHAFQNTVTGPETALPGGGVDTINLSENEIGIAYKHRFLEADFRHLMGSLSDSIKCHPPLISGFFMVEQVYGRTRIYPCSTNAMIRPTP